MVDIEELVKEIKKKDKEVNRSLDEFLPPEKRFKSYTLLKRELFKSKDKKTRKDGRKLEEPRKMFIQLGSVSDARGSCYVELGNTKVILSVRGPKEIPNIQEYTELCVLECLVEYAPFVSNPTSEESFLAEALRLSLEPVLCRHEFPNLQITVSAFIIEDGGSTLSAILMAASCALTHARIPTFGLLTSITVGVHNDFTFIDPTKLEEDFCSNPFTPDIVEKHGLITISYMTQLEQVTFFQSNGSMASDYMTQTINKMISYCEIMHTLCSQHLTKELKNSTQLILKNIETNLAVQNLNINK